MLWPERKKPWRAAQQPWSCLPSANPILGHFLGGWGEGVQLYKLTCIVFAFFAPPPHEFYEDQRGSRNLTIDEDFYLLLFTFCCLLLLAVVVPLFVGTRKTEYVSVFGPVYVYAKLCWCHVRQASICSLEWISEMCLHTLELLMILATCFWLAWKKCKSV